ncbi:hypothetical protein DQ04_15791000, partial [Trypanosoma grayi]|uniref:hypothetical protein n=1 Tax=Trypanosoma grayi TaxID=71804 RepID=UPI0004F433D9
MFELYSARKVSMSPAAHEFVIRCEQNGVRKAEWAAGLTPDGDATTAAAAAPGATEGTSPSSVTATARAAPSLMMLLSPRELLKKIAVIDPRGRLERMMEMSTSVVDLQTCARKLQVAVDAADANSNSFDYATTCQLVSKLVSKARRTCGAALLEEAPR